ncbi:CD209 antigen-like protein E [Salvelinus namaycush]|uniref:CD209 antigen-like protein E n=1 Tax=Salvelinus namaycush TaxID=8040 RepID=A0A8U0QY36_SALNM|nr:CD209 antigen-like protein E [Salvelinus namaycush]
MDWPSSRDSCTSLGSHLTILHSKEQHDALEKEARRIGGFDYHFWIGLSDIEKEGDWRWVDNTTLTNKYWNEYSSEPDNHQSGGSHGRTVPPWTAIRRPGLTYRVTTSTNAFVRWMPSGWTESQDFN